MRTDPHAGRLLSAQNAARYFGRSVHEPMGLGMSVILLYFASRARALLAAQKGMVALGTARRYRTTDITDITDARDFAAGFYVQDLGH